MGDFDSLFPMVVGYTAAGRAYRRAVEALPIIWSIYLSVVPRTVIAIVVGDDTGIFFSQRAGCGVVALPTAGWTRPRFLRSEWSSRYAVRLLEATQEFL